MRSNRFGIGVLGALACVAALLAPAGAQEPAAPPDEPVAEARDVDDEALAVVQRMTDALAKATAVRFEIETSYDAVQTDGEKIEFGAVREITVRRPDSAQAQAFRSLAAAVAGRIAELAGPGSLPKIS